MTGIHFSRRWVTDRRALVFSSDAKNIHPLLRAGASCGPGLTVLEPCSRVAIGVPDISLSKGKSCYFTRFCLFKCLSKQVFFCLRACFESLFCARSGLKQVIQTYLSLTPRPAARWTVQCLLRYEGSGHAARDVTSAMHCGDCSLK